MNEFFEAVSARLTTTFDLAHVGGRFADLLTNVVVAGLTLLVFYVGWRTIQALLRPVLRRAKTDATSSSFVNTILKYGIFTIGAVHALGALGVNTASILASLGVAGLTLGFAAQDTLSNIIAGLLIFWDRPFVIGDLVEVDTHYGRVEKITLRSTRVVTSDGRMLAVPNKVMVNSTVASYTNFPHLRLDVDVTVAVGEDLGRARKVLLGIFADDADYLPDPAPRVVVTAINDYNVALQTQAWIADERRHLAKRYELRERIFVALTEAGVEMPFETIELAPITVAERSAAA